MHYLNCKQVLEEVNSNLNGLTDKQAKDFIAVNGKNELERVKKQSFIKRFFKQFLNIMVAILLLSAVVSISVAIINKEYGDLFEDRKSVV